MKSRKILVPVILVALVLIVTGICIFNKDSNTETANTETSTTDNVNSSKNAEETPATDSNEGSSDSNKNTDSKDTDSSKDSNTSSNDKNAEINKDSNASNNSDTSNNNSNSQNSTVNTIFTEKDAATLLLAYLLGSEELETQHLTPVSLADGTNIASEKADSNTFYFNSEPFTTDATDGIIVTISGYNSANKTYNYELKDYADLLQGQADALATGTVANNGEVTTN